MQFMTSKIVDFSLTMRTGRLPFAKYGLERWGGRVEKHVYIRHTAETCANRQLVPLNTARQIIQDRDYPPSTVNARQLTACRHTLEQAPP
jgi:hypothetical protein